MKYDIVWYYAPHGTGHDGTRRDGYSWHSALPVPSAQEQAASIERQGYRAVTGLISIGPPEGEPRHVPGDGDVPAWSGFPGRMIHLVVNPPPEPTEPCLHCEGSGITHGFTCLGCDGSGRMPEGYERARRYVVDLLRGEELTSRQVERTWELADGFGAGFDFRAYDWDWSHIRDSTAAAFLKMEAYLRGARGEYLGPVEAGAFSWDPETGQVTGPAAYMQERGSTRLRAIEAGKDVVFNHGAADDRDPVATVLVSLQTDYAAWLGARNLEARRGV